MTNKASVPMKAIATVNALALKPTFCVKVSAAAQTTVLESSQAALV
jgi:hypothetical protein